MNLLDRTIGALDREAEGEMDGPVPSDVDRGV